jgi:hypothetical protein
MTETIDDPRYENPTIRLLPEEFVDECQRRGVFSEGELEDPVADLCTIAIERLNQKRLSGTVWLRTDSTICIRHKLIADAYRIIGQSIDHLMLARKKLLAHPGGLIP